MNNRNKPIIGPEEGKRILTLFDALRDLSEEDRTERLLAESLSAAGRERLMRMFALVDRTANMMNRLRINSPSDDADT